MTHEDAKAFAADWQDAWNSRDLTRILAHYADDVVFRSRKAVARVGSGEVVGKPALQDYWAKALAAQPDLRFEVIDVFAGYEMVTLTYRNHAGVLAAEVLWFGPDGLVIQAAACHAV
ncbi:nuclear transport factor 2 family protein [Pseudaestuariivita sp.]|uniref:nuclear transport factor 2 family protein n=1 Tax=Pseudaestuariivita sp. TaxID=2211669 RepID=UPI004058A5BA